MLISVLTQKKKFYMCFMTWTCNPLLHEKTLYTPSNSSLNHSILGYRNKQLIVSLSRIHQNFEA